MGLQAQVEVTATEQSPLVTAIRKRGPQTVAKTLVDKFGDEWRYCWRGGLARPKQLAPDGNWRLWLLLAGRGFGKGRSAAEWIREEVDAGVKGPWHLIGATAADVRDVMIDGPSGLLSVWPERQRPIYEPSKRRLTFHTGEHATTFSAEEPDRLRGPQCGRIWGDELAAWKYPQSTLDMALMGLRLGSDPRGCLTTTPRPIEALTKLLKDSTVAVTRGSTYDNRANLAPAFFAEIVKRYEGTRLGRQELLAEVLDELEGALWTHGGLDLARVKEPPEMYRVVVGVDPSAGDKEGNDEQGIGAAGIGVDGDFYVLADRTVKTSPDGWSKAAVELADGVGADCIYVERNCGGDMAKAVLTNAARALKSSVRIDDVLATRGKHVRAEPIAGLYEQGRVHHVGVFPKLEDELCNFLPSGYIGSKSPNRADAIIWALTALAPSGANKQAQVSGGFEAW